MTTRRSLLVALAGIVAAMPMGIWLRGFIVDDALISARYAMHIALGHGYRFNVDGPVTDGVTPLGWAYVLAPFARSALDAYHAAKIIGIGGWWAACALLALAIDRLEGTRAKWLGLLLVATSVPLGAWSAAGMETGVVMALAAVSASARGLSRELTAASAAGLVAAWRPEALPWAVAMALGPARDPAQDRSRWLKLLLAAGPGVAVGLLRLAWFGHAMPLGAIAKPSSSTLGLRYAVACAILTGVVAIVAYRDVPPWIRGLQAAVLVHFVAIALAGGDWMPVSRLATTALPALALGASAIAGRPASQRRVLSHALSGARLALALAGQLFVVVTQGPRLAGVEARRFATLRALAPSLAESRVVAALDIGWVGAATRANVVDLAGVTDPEVAVLKGGHTSKWIPTWLVDARNVDTLVLRLADGAPLGEPWHQSAFATQVEQWMAMQPGVQESFVLRAVNEEEPRYVVVVRAPAK